MKKKVALACIVLTGLAWYTNISELRRAPREYQAHLEKADECFEKGIYIDAIEEYKAALEYEPENTEVRKKLAKVYLENGERSSYLSTIKAVVEQNQEDAEALNELMDFYLDKGDTKDAVLYLDDFVKKYPENENAAKWYLELKGSYSYLSCWYEDFGPIYNGYMPIYEDEIWGIADLRGNDVIDTQYQYAQVFSNDGYALVENERGYAYIDKKGRTRLVPDKEYQNMGMFSVDGTPASKNGRFGLLDETMEPKTEFEWDDVTSIKDGIGAACKDGKWAVISSEGECVTDYIYDNIIRDAYNYCNMQGVIFAKKGNSYQMLDKKGKQIGKETFKDVLSFSENGYAAVSNGTKWGFADTEGNLVIDYQYEEVQSFSYGYAAVKSGEFWGYIDAENHLIIDTELEYASPFSKDGTAVIKELENDKELIILDLKS